MKIFNVTGSMASGESVGSSMLTNVLNNIYGPLNTIEVDEDNDVVNLIYYVGAYTEYPIFQIPTSNISSYINTGKSITLSSGLWLIGFYWSILTTGYETTRDNARVWYQTASNFAGGTVLDQIYITENGTGPIHDSLSGSSYGQSCCYLLTVESSAVVKNNTGGSMKYYKVV